MTDLVTTLKNRHKVLGIDRAIILAAFPKECKSYLLWEGRYLQSVHLLITLNAIQLVGATLGPVTTGSHTFSFFISFWLVPIGLSFIICGNMSIKRHHELCIEYYNPHRAIVQITKETT